jgi:cellulose synthase/poly-beta-1,6-N-acetylglucosamine synthase-like glycosyltransferase
LAAFIVFFVGVAWIVYVLLGYPLLVGWLARGRPPLRRAYQPLEVSVLLPVHNGGPWLESKLASLKALDGAELIREVIVISDGSSDQTEAIAREWADRGVRLVSIARGGKAAALNAGLTQARGAVLLFTDVRQPLAPGALLSLLSCLSDPSVGVVSGELMLPEGDTREQADISLYWRYEKWIRRNLSSIDSIPGATGAIYAMRRELARPLPPDTLLDDVHLPLYAFFAGYRIVFDDQAFAFDAVGGLAAEFRRKVRTLGGNYQLLMRCPALLNPRKNRMWFHFVSHKLARLALPFALLAVAISSFWLPEPWRTAALGTQAAVCLIALTDIVMPQRFWLKRVTSPVRTFLVLMAAALCAISIFFVPASRLWGAGDGRTSVAGA